MGWNVAVFLAGLIVGVLIAVDATENIMERNVEKGQIAFHGDFYRLVPVTPPAHDRDAR